MNPRHFTRFAEARRDRLIAEIRSDLNRNILKPGEVATLFRVTRKTIAQWANEGKIPHFKTPGGHNRFPALEILDILESLGVAS